MSDGMGNGGPRARIARNPFYVLGLPVGCSRAEVEREGQKLLGMLAVGLSAARTYDTPLGALPRTAEAVREAMAELRDPERRLMHEMWARLPARTPETPEAAGEAGPAQNAGAAQDAAGGTARGTDDAAGPAHADSAAPWAEAMAVLGWQPGKGSSS